MQKNWEINSTQLHFYLFSYQLGRLSLLLDNPQLYVLYFKTEALDCVAGSFHNLNYTG